MCKYICGNKKTLNKPGVRDSLLEFHKKWYSSNIMTLSILGKFQISQMEQMVMDKFSSVVNKQIVMPDVSVPKPYPTSHLSKFIKFVPVKDEDKLTFFYPLPNR